MFKHLAFCALLFFSLPLSAQTIHAQTQNRIEIDEEIFHIAAIQDPTIEAKLLSATAGDPALNGLLLSLAVKSDQQWNVYFLKDIADYRILPSAKNGYLKLQLRTEHLDSTSHVTSQTSILFVNMTAAAQAHGSIQIEEIVQKP
ncbi:MULTISPECIES: hypothetical protein [Vitreoscilla]|uniref:Uncharacterized protein n=1 Tax=Vitreoscilla stercoraria TaxID=61 RepID=A0ABY4E8D9_VITST|nr:MULTISPECIES: hypothetical protein [Vitreoscilla]AUZ04243.2 hypothetical protein ADP71_04510 [Vitreoscilla sp. C1]UOO92005.1 hypothetical protein LVJ81_10265 [Vitreoscilla stercoraria]